MKTINVAVAVVVNTNNQVLISFRHPDLHQGNLWEFPGGKLEPGETVQQALRRELLEELGLEIRRYSPLKTIRHDYADKSVVLHVWRISEWAGEPRGLEGQAVAWRSITNLNSEDFPAANAAIIKLLKLPSLIAITPAANSLPALNEIMQQLFKYQLDVIQLRQPQLSANQYLEWFKQTDLTCRATATTLMFNGELADFQRSGGKGYHANTARLMSLSQRPVSDDCLFSASCHNLEELQKATELGADYVTLSPVGKVAKYSDTAQLGWQGFQNLAQQVSLPVYGLGGLARTDMDAALAAGAHGICGVSLFLDGENSSKSLL